MKNVLHEILTQKKQEVALLKKSTTLQALQEKPLFTKPTRSLSLSIRDKGFGIIAEIKRKSPSAGVIVPKLDIQDLALSYENAGAAGISCLTDQHYFGGSTEDLQKVAECSAVPVLRKEFIIDEIQIFESKAFGADAILLIAEVLTKEEILHFTIIAQSLGLEVLLELHHTSELHKINEHVDLIGINNRDLKAQKTDIQRSLDLLPYLPTDRIRISESGIRTKEELFSLQAAGFQGALIGESILRNENPQQFIQSLKHELCF